MFLIKPILTCHLIKVPRVFISVFYTHLSLGLFFKDNRGSPSICFNQKSVRHYHSQFYLVFPFLLISFPLLNTNTGRGSIRNAIFYPFIPINIYSNAARKLKISWDQYFPCFSYFANQFHVEWNNSKSCETRKILAILTIFYQVKVQ